RATPATGRAGTPGARPGRHGAAGGVAAGGEPAVGAPAGGASRGLAARLAAGAPGARPGRTGTAGRSDPANLAAVGPPPRLDRPRAAARGGALAGSRDLRRRAGRAGVGRKHRGPTRVPRPW